MNLRISRLPALAVSRATRLALALLPTCFMGYGPATEAFAQGLSVPTASLSVSAYPNTCAVNCTTLTSNGFGTISEAYPAGQSFLGPYPAGHADASASYGNPAAEVTAAASGNALADADMKYYFSINGPANTTVPITFSGTFTLIAGIDFASEGVFVSNGVSTVFELSPFLVGGYGPFVADFNAVTGVVYQVELQASTASNNTSQAGYTDVQLTISCPKACAGFQLNSSPPPLQITTTSLPSAVSGQPYGPSGPVPITATGGTGRGYNWCIQSGPTCVQTGAPLPRGFALGAEGSCGATCTDVFLSSMGIPAANVGSYPFTVQVTDSAGHLATQPLTLVVNQCPINVTWLTSGASASSPGGTTMELKATSGEGLALADAAKACGYAAFDWMQTVTHFPNVLIDPDHTLDRYLESDPAVALVAPWVEPPPGGYTYQFADPNWAIAQPNFVTANPYYYSPQDLAKGCALVPKGGGGCLIRIMSDAYTLNFLDTPTAAQCEPPTLLPCFQEFTTQLVGVCQALTPTCPSPGPGPALFQITWETNYDGTTGGIFNASASLYPVDPGSGTGGVTVTNINGVQLPTAISPSQVATTASGLVYSRVSHTFNGTVTLTNISGGAISGPLQVLFTGLTPGVTLANATGNLSGTPYLTIPTLALAPGQPITVSVQFTNPSNAAINFMSAIYSGNIG